MTKRSWDDTKKARPETPAQRGGYEKADRALRIAREIRALREKQGISQRELAERVGTTQSAIARLEVERSRPVCRRSRRSPERSAPSYRCRSSSRPSWRGLGRRCGLSGSDTTGNIPDGNRARVGRGKTERGNSLDMFNAWGVFFAQRFKQTTKGIAHLQRFGVRFSRLASGTKDFVPAPDPGAVFHPPCIAHAQQHRQFKTAQGMFEHIGYPLFGTRRIVYRAFFDSPFQSLRITVCAHRQHRAGELQQSGEGGGVNHAGIFQGVFLRVAAGVSMPPVRRHDDGGGRRHMRLLPARKAQGRCDFHAVSSISFST